MSQPRGLSRLFGPGTKTPAPVKKEVTSDSKIVAESKGDATLSESDSIKTEPLPDTGLEERLDSDNGVESPCNGTEKVRTRSSKKEDAAKLLEILEDDHPSEALVDVDNEVETVSEDPLSTKSTPRRVLRERRQREPEPKKEVSNPKGKSSTEKKATESSKKKPEEVTEEAAKRRAALRTPKRKAVEEEKPLPKTLEKKKTAVAPVEETKKSTPSNSKLSETTPRASARLQSTKRKFSVKELFKKPAGQPTSEDETDEPTSAEESTANPKKARRLSMDNESLKGTDDIAVKVEETAVLVKEETLEDEATEKDLGSVVIVDEAPSVDPLEDNDVAECGMELRKRKSSPVTKKGAISPRRSEKKEVKEAVQVTPDPKPPVTEEILIREATSTTLDPKVKVVGVKPKPRDNRVVDIFGRVKSPPKPKPIKLATLIAKDEDGEVIVKDIEIADRSDPKWAAQETVDKLVMDESFDKFFATKGSIVEHNDSFESDSGEDGQYPEERAIENPQHEEIVGGDSDEQGVTIYDLMQTISEYMPSWNLHILEDSTFCITEVARGPAGLPILKKIIELDADFNAKVYVNQVRMKHIQGVYNTYDSIKTLIETVHQL